MQRAFPMATTLALVATTTAAWAWMPNHGVGRPGGVVVLQVAVSPERFDPDFVAGLKADLEGEAIEAARAYDKARRMKRCGPRCVLHRQLSNELLGAREASIRSPAQARSNVSYAIGLHNKIVSLRIDTGRLPQGLVDRALKHYRIALDLAGPIVRNEVLLGLAALHGELGETGRALELFAQVRLENLESAVSHGNLAYFLTTVGRYDEAFRSLERALTLEGRGGTYRTWARTSDDYHRVRHLRRFQEILELY